MFAHSASLLVFLLWLISIYMASKSLRRNFLILLDFVVGLPFAQNIHELWTVDVRLFVDVFTVKPQITIEPRTLHTIRTTVSSAHP